MLRVLARAGCYSRTAKSRGRLISFQRILIRFLFVFAVCGALACLAYRLQGSPRTGIDDADITLVYASHLAHGQGLVYNDGGERVEGFTSLLWVLICTLAVKVSSSPEEILRLLSVGLLAATHAAVTLYLDGLRQRKDARKRLFISSASILYLGLLCASPAYFTWMTITVMDTCIWGTLVAFAVLCVLREPADSLPRIPVGLCILMGLLVLARPEALALCPAIIAIRWARLSFAGQPLRAVVRSSVWPSITFLATAGGLTAACLLYFGYPLPNTYYAKVSPSLAYNVRTGLIYLLQFLASQPVVAVSVFLMALFLWYRLTEASSSITDEAARRSAISRAEPVETIAAFSAVLLVLPVLTGGDHFAWSRFYQPVYPLLILGLVCVMAEVRSWFQPPRLANRSNAPFWNTGAIAISLAFALLVTPLDLGWLGLARGFSPLSDEFQLAATERQVGREFTTAFRNLPRFPSVGVVTAGGFKRTYPGEVIDLMGLNNIAMGHSPGDRKGPKNHAAFSAPVFFQLLPDVVTPDIERLGPLDAGGPTIQREEFWDQYLHHLDHDQRFQALYVYGWMRAKQSAESTWVAGYFARTFVSKVEQTGLYDVLLAVPGAKPLQGSDSNP